MKCSFDGCDNPIEYVSSRWTTPKSKFPEDVQDLVDDKTISGNGILAEYWCKIHSPPNADSIEE